MGTLKQDIRESSSWIIKAFKADKLMLDYSIESFIEIDKFFNKHTINGKAKPGGRFANNLGGILFSIAAYIIETIMKKVPGSRLVTDDEAADGELTVSIELPNGGVIWPMQRVMKRFQNGQEDSIYFYGYELTKEFTNEAFDELYWDKIKDIKKWWKFWKR
jgi:hypothetical protein